MRGNVVAPPKSQNYRLKFIESKEGQKMKNKAKTIKVHLPSTGMTFEEEEEYIQREFGVGRIDSSDDVPADEDCEGIFELEFARG